jgi:hypothetical protein
MKDSESFLEMCNNIVGLKENSQRCCVKGKIKVRKRIFKLDDERITAEKAVLDELKNT